MKKAECEKAIRALVHTWARQTGGQPGQPEMPSFSAFRCWMEDSGYGGYFAFQSEMGPYDDAERWFDQELKQAWRN